MTPSIALALHLPADATLEQVKEYLQAVKAEADRATPLPWNVSKFGAIHGGESVEYTNGTAQPQIALATLHQEVTPESRDANCLLMAHSRQNVPDLASALLIALGDVERLNWLESSEAEVNTEMIEDDPNDDETDSHEGWACYAIASTADGKKQAVSVTADTLRAAIDAAREGR